ncbi:MAG: arsenite methyltransferase [Bacteroidia bacterium]|nr:arsenite methyltransferase [Bacteroidia bacterium]
MENLKNEDLKNLVKEKYSEIAKCDAEANMASCCGGTCSSTEVYNIMTDDYSKTEGYNKDADLGLGCGLPTEFAKIKEGDTVIDLGSGAGNDCFVARSLTGEKGKVIGVDFSEAMIARAQQNVDKRGFNNVQFRLGDIENIPVTSCVADVVVSNCVLNLVPDKQKVFHEIKRVLKNGGHFSISDVVLEGELPESVKKTAEFYAGCISGAIQKNNYLSLIEKAGFKNITVQKEKQIIVPDDILKTYLNENEIATFKNSKAGIFSITVYAEKPEDCCEGSGCCN